VVAGEGVLLVDAGAAADREEQPGLDPSVGVELATLDAGASTAGDLVARGRVLVAAMQAGICEATRDESAAYAKVREQFGKPIGTFQAVKHRCADMAVRAEATGGLTFLAALSLQDRTPEAPALVGLAKALASEHALANAADDIQNHGGTGFTAECPAHRYLKRANLLATVLGTPAALYAEAGRHQPS
jgi:alkylation response protein AidB-like acyl-CoA dehydrogenase